MFQTTDFDELAHALRGWKADFHQLGRGPFHGQLQFLQAGAVQIADIAVNRVIQGRGTTKPGSYGFSLVTTANADARWRGRQLKPGQINLNDPSGVVDHLSSSDYRIQTILADASKLQESAVLLYGMDLEERLNGVMALTASRTAFASISDNLQHVLKIAGPRPLLPRSSAIAIERTCIRQVLQVLASAGTFDTIETSNPDRLRMVRQAEEFMLANLNQPLLTEDICTEIAVSERTLRYAFQDRFGLSPMAYTSPKN